MLSSYCSCDASRDSEYYIDVLRACKLYELHQLGLCCVSVLLKYMTTSNILGIIESAYDISDQNLQESCLDFIHALNEGDNLLYFIVIYTY